MPVDYLLQVKSSQGLATPNIYSAVGGASEGNPVIVSSCDRTSAPRSRCTTRVTTGGCDVGCDPADSGKKTIDIREIFSGLVKIPLIMRTGGMMSTSARRTLVVSSS